MSSHAPTIAPDAGTRLRAEDVKVRYGATEVLHGLSLAIPPGRVTALIGPNGSGKSTFLAALARLLRPHHGTVLLDGASIHAQPTRDVARRLGILPQNPQPPEAITAGELVARGRYPHQTLFRPSSDDDRQAVAEAMRLTGTLDFADRPMDTLSGGQRQRCWIAMALAQQSRIILFDEPTAFLDIRHQIDILDLLVRLTREHGRTIVVVLHDLNFAAAYADYLVLLEAGALYRHGSVEDMFTDENIARLFSVPVHVVRHPDSGRPVCLPRMAPGA